MVKVMKTILLSYRLLYCLLNCRTGQSFDKNFFVIKESILNLENFLKRYIEARRLFKASLSKSNRFLFERCGKICGNFCKFLTKDFPTSLLLKRPSKVLPKPKSYKK